MKRNPVRTPVDMMRRKEIVLAYAGGASSKDLARLYGAHPRTIERYARAAGVSRPGGARPRGASTTTLLALRARGLTCGQIAVRTGMVCVTVQKRLRVARDQLRYVTPYGPAPVTRTAAVDVG